MKIKKTLFFTTEYHHRIITSSCSVLVASQYFNLSIYLCAKVLHNVEHLFLLSMWLNGKNDDKAPFVPCYAIVLFSVCKHRWRIPSEGSKKFQCCYCYFLCARHASTAHMDDELHNWLQIWIITLRCSIILVAFSYSRFFFDCAISKKFCGLGFARNFFSRIFFFVRFFISILFVLLFFFFSFLSTEVHEMTFASFNSILMWIFRSLPSSQFFVVIP